MRRSSSSWKFEIAKLTNETIVIGATIRPGQASDSRAIKDVSRAKIVVQFDKESKYALTLDRHSQEITLPLSENRLPSEVSFMDAITGKSLSSPLKTAKLFNASLRIINVKGHLISGSVSSSIDLPYLPVEFFSSDNRIFARGKATRSMVDQTLYNIDLPIRHLIPLLEGNHLETRIFGRVMPNRLKVDAKDIGILGYIDVAGSKGILGWACNAQSPEPLLVTLRVDGAPLTTTLADQPRPDLRAWNISNTKSGFAFSKEILSKIPKNAEISVTVGDPGIHLVNSPCVINP